jgi:AcrR family transcriptional regulator
MAGRGDSSTGRARTPRVELARIRAAQTREITRLRERIMEAAIEACGERGYRDATVQDTIDRYGGHRQQFYKHFSGKAECYAVAYEFEVERLYSALRTRAIAEPSWHRGLFAILSGLAELICERPAFARGLLVEVHVAGGPALLKRLEVFERLTRAVDSARHETESRHSPPPVTATFMVGAIEAAVTSALTRAEPEDFAAAVPELAHMVLAAYFGDEIAGDETAFLRDAA